ncbi:MAG: hypothetical protein JWM68_1988, partial [Verrucomicrobiales bacterium]|nr:hypothetical protein [Verrucomicrobiales bacterium]
GLCSQSSAAIVKRVEIDQRRLSRRTRNRAEEGKTKDATKRGGVGFHVSIKTKFVAKEKRKIIISGDTDDAHQRSEIRRSGDGSGKCGGFGSGVLNYSRDASPFFFGVIYSGENFSLSANGSLETPLFFSHFRRTDFKRLPIPFSPEKFPVADFFCPLF